MEQSLSEPSRKAVAIARDLCRRHGHPAVGTEHILYGLASVQVDPEFAAATGLDSDRIETIILDQLPKSAALSATADMPLTPRAKRLLESAMTIALERGDDRIGSIHLFAAFRRLPVCGALRVLKTLGIDPDRLPSSIETRCRTERAAAAEAPEDLLKLSDAMRPVLAAALESAREYHFERILPWHMLLGLTIASDDISKDLIRRLGLSEAAVRAEIARMIDEVAHGGG